MLGGGHRRPKPIVEPFSLQVGRQHRHRAGSRGVRRGERLVHLQRQRIPLTQLTDHPAQRSRGPCGCQVRADPALAGPGCGIGRIPAGPAGQHDGHRDHVGLARRKVRQAQDPVDAVAARSARQIIVGADIGGNLIQRRAPGLHVELIQQVLQLPQRSRHARWARDRAWPPPCATTAVATHRSIIALSAARMRVNLSRPDNNPAILSQLIVGA
ncbi:hypothetical protein [Nonomuraea aurantiaca]|uniref:hypothetical protein n=1 Tax=Nonomuraea aurantiaca TaxID=2878562 RepID=UPI003558015F